MFRTELFDHDAVTMLAARAGDDDVAGAVLNRCSMVVGISNFFTKDRSVSANWSGCLALAGTLFPALRDEAWGGP